MKATVSVYIMFLPWSLSLVPPKFQWKTIDFAWASQKQRNSAVLSGDYVSVHNMPTGIARWRDKLFITIPRWKKGVPSSLNYVKLTDPESPLLRPYPNWEDAFVRDSSPEVNSDATVVSTFRVHVDKCDRLWVADNGLVDMSGEADLVSNPAVVVFDLKTDEVIHRFELSQESRVVVDISVLSSITVEIVGKGCSDSYAYVTDMGANAIIVCSLASGKVWRIEHPYFAFDPNAAAYKVGGIKFYWNDGVSSSALSKVTKDGFSDLYFYPTSSTKQFKMSTQVLRGNRNLSLEELFDGVQIVGDRGPQSQSTACDFDHKTNILFFTQLNKNGFSCWNTDRPFNKEFTPLLMSDCNLLEYPNDIKVDREGNLWILSDRQSKFLYDTLSYEHFNFRILTAPVSEIIKGTSCEVRSNFVCNLFYRIYFSK